MKPSVLISGVTLLCILFSCIEQRQLSETDTSTPELANTFQSDLDFLAMAGSIERFLNPETL
jgi:hypothetical protein